MSRLARIVVPGLPHHVTQRGEPSREAIFFQDGDHEIYLDLLAEQMLKADVAVWAYCLMPNHVHLIFDALVRRMPWGGQWAKRIGATLISSMLAGAGRAIYTRAVSHQLPWTTRT